MARETFEKLYKKRKDAGAKLYKNVRREGPSVVEMPVLTFFVWDIIMKKAQKSAKKERFLW